MNFDFGFIGWCHDTEENHDKIWGFFYRSPSTNKRFTTGMAEWADYDRDIVIFWGRRGKAMQFKGGKFSYDTQKLMNEKENKKNYTKINEGQLLQIWPSFKEEAELKLSLEVLSGRVK